MEEKNKCESLTSEELSNVTGGDSTREKTMIVPVDLSLVSIEGDIEIEPYLNGILQTNMVKTVDGRVGVVYLKFTGRGKKSLLVKINGETYKTYEINLDTYSYVEL